MARAPRTRAPRRRGRSGDRSRRGSCRCRSRLFEEPLLAGGRGGWLLTQVQVRLAGHTPAGGRPHDEADLQEIGFDQLGEGFRLVVDGGRDRLEAHRSSTVVVDDRAEKAPVETVETARVDALAVERAARDVLGNAPVTLHLRVVTHAAEQPVDDSWRPAGATRDLPRAIRLDPRLEDDCRARHDPGALSLRV